MSSAPSAEELHGLLDEAMSVLATQVTAALAALAEAQAELARHEHCIEEIQRDGALTAERDVELLEEGEAKIAELTSALAGARIESVGLRLRLHGAEEIITRDVPCSCSWNDDGHPPRVVHQCLRCALLSRAPEGAR